MKVEILTRDTKKVVALFGVLDKRYGKATLRFKNGKYPSVVFMPDFTNKDDSILIYSDAHIDFNLEGIAMRGEPILRFHPFDGNSRDDKETVFNMKCDSSMMLYMHDEEVDRLEQITKALEGA